MIGRKNNKYLEIKEHTHKKYTILRKYLEACKKFADKYGNFVYIDTHGGSGKVLDIKTGKLIDGSPLIARKLVNPTFPCYAIEVRKDRYKLLKKSTKNLQNFRVIWGDCNKKIEEILKNIEEWKFFLDFFIKFAIFNQF